MMDEPPSKAAEVRSNYQPGLLRYLGPDQDNAQLYFMYHLGFLVLTHHWVYNPMMNPGHHIPAIIVSTPNIVRTANTPLTEYGNQPR